MAASFAAVESALKLLAIWLAYGIMLHEMPMMLANSVSLVLALLVLAMKLKYRKREPQQEGGKPRMAKA